jgi:Na+:H+ antiporter, NhaA family
MRLFLAKLSRDAVPGLALLAATALALFISNSGLAVFYDRVQDAHVTLGIAPLQLDKTILHWVNDGLMVLFFFVVTLEIKQELVSGTLSRWDQAALPLFAAIGGMAVPALVYCAFNFGTSAMKGWAIASATDIAFAVGILATLGRRVPLALRLFLLSLAIIDDLGSIVIIALFYANDLSPRALALAAVGVMGLVALNRRHIVAWPAYLLVGLFVWLCVLKSGVHATLAGVAVGAAVPLTGRAADALSPAEHMKHALEPWVNVLILPVFAFLNAGVPLAGTTLASVLAPIPLGIGLGLFVGKQIGIVLLSWLAVRARIAALPPTVTWGQIYGVALLGGIGFTMSLFIGGLAFPNDQHAAAIRLGVIAGSVVSAVTGLMVLRTVLPVAPPTEPSSR